MSNYLSSSSSGLYTYRRRTPSKLLEYINKEIIKLSVGHNSNTALLYAVEVDSAIASSLEVAKLNVPKEVKVQMIESLLAKFFAVSQAKSIPTTFLEVSNEYVMTVQALPNKIHEYKQMGTTIGQILKGVELSKIDFHVLDTLKSKILKLPKRNIQKYRDMSLTSIMKVSIELDERISNTTVNIYLKYLKSVLRFAFNRGYIEKDFTSSIKSIAYNEARLEREALALEEVKMILANVNPEIGYLVKIFLLSGMRLSELYKCKVSKVDDMFCFDLSDTHLKLKTKSSYRVVPVHEHLINELKTLPELLRKYNHVGISRTIKRAIIKLKLPNADKKSLYSLRHTFATELIQRGIDNAIVSELMGHSHHTMTLSRYSKGYTIRTLQDAINTLPD